MSEQRVGVGIGVYIFKGDKVLLGQRQAASTHGAGFWCPPGGKLDFGETFEDCAKREVAEECGLEISEPHIITCTNDIHEEGVHFVTVSMGAKWISGEPEVLEAHKIAQWSWFHISDLPSPLFLPVEKVVRSGILASVINQL